MALDGKFRSIAERKLAGLLGARLQPFAREIGEINSLAIKACSFGGSAHFQLIQDACEKEARERAKVVWKALHAIADELKLPHSASVGEALKALVRQELIDWSKDVSEAMARARGYGALPVNAMDAADIFNAAMIEIEADIDLFVSAPVPQSVARWREASRELVGAIPYVGKALAVLIFGSRPEK